MRNNKTRNWHLTSLFGLGFGTFRVFLSSLTQPHGACSVVRAYNEGSIHAGQEVPTKSSHVINLFYTRTIKAPIYSPLIIIRGCKWTLNFYTSCCESQGLQLEPRQALCFCCCPRCWELELLTGIQLGEIVMDKCIKYSHFNCFFSEFRLSITIQWELVFFL